MFLTRCCSVCRWPVQIWNINVRAGLRFLLLLFLNKYSSRWSKAERREVLNWNMQILLGSSSAKLHQECEQNRGEHFKCVAGIRLVNYKCIFFKSGGRNQKCPSSLWLHRWLCNKHQMYLTDFWRFALSSTPKAARILWTDGNPVQAMRRPSCRRHCSPRTGHRISSRAPVDLPPPTPHSPPPAHTPSADLWSPDV